MASTFSPGNRVAQKSDPSVIGEVLKTSTATGGLRAISELDSFDDADTPERGLIPVRWNTDDGTYYEWWENPEVLNLVRP